MLEFFYPLPTEMYNIPAAASTYPTHGLNKLDFGAPKGTPIYSMTNGYVAFSGIYSDGVSACVIVTNGYGNLDQLSIRYLHGVYNVTAGQQVAQGQQIGTVSDVGSPGSFHLHLDFQYSPINNNGIGMLSPYNNAANQEAIQNNINYWNNKAGHSNFAGYCWQVIGNPAHHRVVSSYEPGSSGGIALAPTCSIPQEYANVVFSDRFMQGGALSTAIKCLVNVSGHEFGFNDYGISYGKVFRSWILYHYSNKQFDFRGQQATIDTFARYWDWCTTGGWGSYIYKCYGADDGRDDLCEIMYKNIKYPDIFGVTNPTCITAMSNCPFQNETVKVGNPQIPERNYPVAFSVCEKYGNGLYYVLYRSNNAITLQANPAVLN